MAVIREPNADVEEAIRRYLIFVDNPKKLVDKEAMQAARKAAREATDPLAKLRAFSDHERAAQPDGDALRKGFVEHAYQWAEEEGVTIGAFRSLKVPDEVLSEAGFPVEAESKPSRPKLTRQGVRDFILNKAPEVFTKPEISEALGVPNSSLPRDVINELTREGLLEEMAYPAEEWDKQGKPPSRYRRVGKPQ